MGAVKTWSVVLPPPLKRTRPRRELFARGNLIRFVLAEAVGILAILFSHRALDLNPAVFVVAVECFVPIFVALLSFIPSAALLLLRGVNTLAPGQVFAAQRQNFLLKSISAVIMAVGTVLLLANA